MPYAIAHPAAAIPLHRLLGRHSVPSALVIGSVIPDIWYLLPFLGRPDTHRASGLLICLPLGLAAYVAFHLLCKQPLLGLFPALAAAKLRAWTCEGLPRAAWAAVLACLAAGCISHLAWDAFTHEGILSRAWPPLRAPVLALYGHEVLLFQLLQHASTLLGAGFVTWWLWRKLAAMPAPVPRSPQAWPRAATALLLAAIPASVFAGYLLDALANASVELREVRAVVRTAAVEALGAFAIAALLYSLAWQVLRRRA